MMEEIWKDVVGWEGIYQVSNLGHVRSLDRMVRRSVNGDKFVKGVLLKPRKDKDGYMTVHLRETSNKRNRLVKVHRLVAGAFIKNSGGKEQVDHINGVRSDNRVDNLRYCTAKENNNFPLAKINRSSAITRSYINNPELRKMRANTLSGFNRHSVDVYKNGVFVGAFISQTDAARTLGLSQTKVSMCVNGKLSETNGYVIKRHLW